MLQGSTSALGAQASVRGDPPFRRRFHQGPSSFFGPRHESNEAETSRQIVDDWTTLLIITPGNVNNGG